MNFKKIEIFVIVAIIAVIGIIFAFRKPAIAPTSQTTSQTQNQTPTPTQQVPTSVIEYSGVDGKNALELLKVSHQVEAKHYDFGDLVTGIDGISPDASHFWALYVNGQLSQVGASAYVTKNTDQIRWQIDAVTE